MKPLDDDVPPIRVELEEREFWLTPPAAPLLTGTQREDGPNSEVVLPRYAPAPCALKVKQVDDGECTRIVDLSTAIRSSG